MLLGDAYEAHFTLRVPMRVYKKHDIAPNRIVGKFYQTGNVRKISRLRLFFPLRKRQGQLGIHHQLTERKYAVHVRFSSTWKRGQTVRFISLTGNFTKRLMSWKCHFPDSFPDFGYTQGKLNIHRHIKHQENMPFISRFLAHSKRD